MAYMRQRPHVYLYPISSRLSQALTILVVAGVGYAAVMATHAASATGSAEAEGGTLVGGASIIADSGASGGRAVQFHAVSSGGGGTSGGGGSSGGGTTTGSGSTKPYASALSNYTTLAQSYTASQMISQNWAQDANDTQEGGSTCSLSNTTYDSANTAVKLYTSASGKDCADIRSATTVPTKNAVIESKIYMPGSSSTSMLDWGSFWTDGANASGQENWPITGEVDAVETQFGQSYVSIHCGCMQDYNASTDSPTEVWTTEPSGWEDKDTTYAKGSGSNIGPGWTVVDIAFDSNGSASIYYNGTLYVTVPASALTWNTGHTYVVWGISAGYSTSGWPTGAAAEEVQYLKVFTQ